MNPIAAMFVASGQGETAVSNPKRKAVNAAVNHLLKRGYSVIDPDGKPCTLKEGTADA